MGFSDNACRISSNGIDLRSCLQRCIHVLCVIAIYGWWNCNVSDSGFTDAIYLESVFDCWLHHYAF